MLKFAFLIPLLNLIPVFTGLNVFLRLKSNKSILFSYYLIITATCGMICLFLALNGKNNHWCYNCLQIIIFILAGLIFYVEFQKKLILYITICVTLFLIVNTFIVGFCNFNQLNFNIIFTSFGIISGVCIKNYMLKSIKEKYDKYSFWMYCGFFVFSFGTIFPNLFFSIVLNKTSELIFVFYSIYQFVLNLIVNLIFVKSVNLIKNDKF